MSNQLVVIQEITELHVSEEGRVTVVVDPPKPANVIVVSELPGPRGPQGDEGPQGIQGEDGPQGIPGFEGVILLEANQTAADVPVGTPVGTIIYRKA